MNEKIRLVFTELKRADYRSIPVKLETRLMPDEIKLLRKKLAKHKYIDDPTLSHFVVKHAFGPPSGVRVQCFRLKVPLVTRKVRISED